MRPKKIDITAYDTVSRFAGAHKDSRKNETAAYRSGDYLSYIKHRCLSLLFMWSNFSFRYKIESTILPEVVPFSCFQFPISGKEHDFQAFNKLNHVEKIPAFNKSHSDFYSKIIPVWIKIQDFMTEHHKRWKAMSTHEKVVLLDRLHLLYEGRENSVIYDQCYIFENQYLHQQFDRFISAQDFNEWWGKEVLEILRPEDGFEPKSAWDDFKLLLKSNKGILQSDFYKICKDLKADVSSTLYFAEKDGELIRKKEGHSYRLYLPEQLKNVGRQCVTGPDARPGAKRRAVQ
jgi:hypothetical protein